MLVIVVIGLSVSLLIVLGIGLVTLLDVAFSGPPELSDNSPWQPPLARENDLFAWASDLASAVATKRLKGPRSEDTARQLATEIYQGSSLAIARSPSAPRPLKPRCTSCRHRMIGVTAPEALTVADALRTSQGKREVQRIHDLAAANAAAAAGLDHVQYQQAQLVCPLLTSDSTCVVYDARPIRCRGWSSPPGETAPAMAAKGNCNVCDPHADAVGRGAEEGLSQALGSAGLDGDIYELNSALVAALDTPHAAQRWARGEPVFAGCKEYA